MHQSSNVSQCSPLPHNTHPRRAGSHKLKIKNRLGAAGLRLFVCGLVATISGCGSMGMYNGYGVNPLSEGVNSATGNLPEVQELRKQIEKNLGETSPNTMVGKTCFSNTPESTCNTSRNNAVASLLIASDDMCQKHLKSIFGNEAGVNIATGTVAIMSSGWATLTNGVAAKTSLSALSTFANAERSLINETVYKERMVTAITTKIRQAREQKSLDILHHFNDSIATYPVMLALSDVVKYHYTCSFMYGLEKALDEGVQSSLESKKVKLEQEKQQLINFIDARTGSGKHDPTVLEGARNRVQEIDKALQTMVNMDATTIPAAQGMAAVLDDFPVQVAHIDSINNKFNKAKGDLAAKAKASGALKEKLSELGLDKPFVAPDTGIINGLRRQCITKISDYATAESIALTQAEQEKDAARKEVLLAEAKPFRAKRNEIVVAAKKLADDYRAAAEAEKTFKNWNDLFDKAASNASAENIADFKARLDKDKLPPLDTGHLGSLCNQ